MNTQDELAKGQTHKSCASPSPPQGGQEGRETEGTHTVTCVGPHLGPLSLDTCKSQRSRTVSSGTRKRKSLAFPYQL